MLFKVTMGDSTKIVDAHSKAAAKKYVVKSLLDSINVSGDVSAADLAGVDLSTIPVIVKEEKAEGGEGEGKGGEGGE